MFKFNRKRYNEEVKRDIEKHSNSKYKKSHLTYMDGYMKPADELSHKEKMEYAVASEYVQN